MASPAAGLCLLEAETDPANEFRTAVLAGLGKPRKEIPSKFFYDHEGSRLFEKICALQEYYPTRAETEILTERVDEIAALLPEGVVLIEFGSGASVKVRLLLDALHRARCYVPLDISREHLLAAAESLSRDYPSIRCLAGVRGLHASFPSARYASARSAARIFSGFHNRQLPSAGGYAHAGPLRRIGSHRRAGC